MKRIYFIEQGGFVLNGNKNVSGDNISDRKADLNEILELKETNIEFYNKLEAFCNKQNGGSNLFYIGNSKIRAKNFVGIIRFRDITIEILPKIFGSNINILKAKNIILKRLLFMLSYIKETETYTTGSANQRITNTPFIEIFIRHYADTLYKLLIKNYRLKYREVEDNLSVLKGKILWNEHLRKNYVNKHKIYQQYDEYNENHLLYNIFKCVSLFLLFKTTSSYTKKILNNIIFLLADVNYFEVEKIHFDKVSFDRLNDIYRNVFNLGYALYFEKIPAFSKAKNEFYALYFDMNKLYEEFLYRFIKRHINFMNNIEILWGEMEYLFSRDSNQKIEYDIRLMKNDDIFNRTCIIFDAKNRLEKLSSKYFPESHVYQMISYMEVTKNDNPIAYLIYQSDNENKIEEIYEINNSNKKIGKIFLNIFDDKEKLIEFFKNNVFKNYIKN